MGGGNYCKLSVFSSLVISIEIAEIQPEIIENEPEIQPETKQRGRPKKEPAPKPEPKKRGRPPKPIVNPSPQTPTVAERPSTAPTMDQDTYNQYFA